MVKSKQKRKIKKFERENDENPQFFQGGYFYRLVPFTK